MRLRPTWPTVDAPYLPCLRTEFSQAGHALRTVGRVEWSGMATITLGAGVSALVDDEDEDLAGLRWHRTAKGYARRSYRDEDGVVRAEYLQQAVAARIGLAGRVRFVDGDRLNCRRHNLREA